MEPKKDIPILHKVYGTGAGKGDKRRPTEVSAKEFAANWDRVFGEPRRKICRTQK